MIAHQSGVRMQVDGYAEVRGAERANLRLCVDSFGCHDVELGASEETDGELDCRVTGMAEGHETECRAFDDGAITLWIHPTDARPEPRARDYDLVFQQGELEIHAPGIVWIEALYQSGPDCGVTSVRGTLDLDPITFASR